MTTKLTDFATKHNEKVLKTPHNSISMALTLNSFKEFSIEEEAKNNVTSLGSILYSKRVMGSRILGNVKNKKVCGLEFKNYGTHSNDYPNLPYMTVACAIGM